MKSGAFPYVNQMDVPGEFEVDETSAGDDECHSLGSDTPEMDCLAAMLENITLIPADM